MALSKIQPASMDLTDNYAFTGTNSISGAGDIEETKLATLTASSSSTLSFTSSIDNTYNIYKFRYFDFHPQNDGVYLSFQTSTNTGSSYGVTVTSTSFVNLHNEADNDTHLGYSTTRDLAQSTSFLASTDGYGNDNDQCGAGELFLFNPSSTTFVKHWLWDDQTYNSGNYSARSFNAGYFNTTSAINAIQFKFSGGNIDSGTIEMYGIN